MTRIFRPRTGLAMTRFPRRRLSRHRRHGSPRMLLSLLAIVLLAGSGCQEAAPVLFGPATDLAPADDALATGIVGRVVSAPPGVRLLDRHGNPAVGIPVRFRLVGTGGSLTGVEVRTDETGRARPQLWVLGPQAGIQQLTAEVDGLGALDLEADAAPGPAERVVSAVLAPDQAPAGGSVDERVRVRVEDAFGNPVPGHLVTFAVTGGGGQVVPTTTLTNAEGLAQVARWTLGTAPGPNRLEARIEGASPVVFEVQGLPELFVTAVHLNQGNQFLEGAPAVAGRPGLLRIFPVTAQPDPPTPLARISLFSDGVATRTEDLMLGEPIPVGSTSTAHLSASWNLEVAAHEVTPGLGLRVELVLEPEGGEGVPAILDPLLPSDGGIHSIPVEELAPLRLELFPIQSTVHDRTGNITPSNLETFLADTRRWIPSGEIEANIRPPFVTDHPLTSFAGWSSLLSDLQAVRVAEGASDEYYHGIVPDFDQIGFAGLAYVPTQPTSVFRSGLTWDRLPQASATLAHELGHNLGRRHAPCGNPAGVDMAFPHPDAGIGGPGWDVITGQVRFPSGHADYMGYCGPRWTSDYTWTGILNWRLDDPLAADLSSDLVAAHRPMAARPDAHRASGPTPVPASASAAGPGLLLWGRVTSTGVHLRPAIALEGHPVLPAGPGTGSGTDSRAGPYMALTTGPHQLRGIDSEGQELFRVRFEGEPVDHSPDPAERHFAFLVPLSEDARDRLHLVELTSPQGVARQNRSDSDRMALIREPDSGRILALGHPEALGLVTAEEVALFGRPGADLEVLLSDGIGTRVLKGRAVPPRD